MRQNKTAPLEEEQNYELPPLKAWDSPPSTLNGTLNGFPASRGVSPKRLEPLGPPRLPGILCLCLCLFGASLELHSSPKCRWIMVDTYGA